MGTGRHALHGVVTGQAGKDLSRCWPTSCVAKRRKLARLDFADMDSCRRLERHVNGKLLTQGLEANMVIKSLVRPLKAGGQPAIVGAVNR
jgi:hypothetical protein